MLSNEVYSFQAAYYWSDLRKQNVQVRLNSEILPWITIRSVSLVPSELPCYPDLWITVNPAREQIKPGIYPIEIVVHESFSEQELSKAIFHLRVIDELLPKQILVHTEWFHADCIATYYGLEVFSEGHWERMDH
jgi:hypothetical protein